MSTSKAGGKSTGGSTPGYVVLFLMVGVAWAVEVVEMVPGIDLDRFGILPRRWEGLPGVLLSPFLHTGFPHLIANTMTFIGLGLIVLAAEGKRFGTTTFVLVVTSGLGTWLIGRPNSVHIGASGLIYGYFGYVVGRAIWERKAMWILVGIVVGLLYGGMIFGVLPNGGMVSWEGHLAGLVAGLWLGREHARQGKGR